MSIFKLDISDGFSAADGAVISSGTLNRLARVRTAQSRPPNSVYLLRCGLRKSDILYDAKKQQEPEVFFTGRGIGPCPSFVARLF